MWDATEPSSIAVQLARMPVVVEALLAQHIPDAKSRCRGCGLPGTGSAYLEWPCSLWLVANSARRLVASRN